MHEEVDKVWDDDECKYMAHNQVEWYLKRGSIILLHMCGCNILANYEQGEEVSTKNTTRKSYYRTYRTEADFSGSFSEWIDSCDEKTPPSRKTDVVTRMCLVECRVPVIFSKLKSWINPKGKELKRLDYDIEMVPSGATLEFNIYFEGRKMGASNVAITFE